MIMGLSVLSAQNNRTSYFLDGYTYNFRLNPAFTPERGFVAIPVLGNVSIGAESNLALSTFVYPTSDGRPVLFIDDSVSDTEFLSKLNKRNMINSNLNLTLLAFGFKTGKFYHTFDVSLKAQESSLFGKDLLEFIKVGSANGTHSWNLGNIGASVRAYGEVAYGLSASIGESLRLGGRIKLLLGIARTDMMIDRLDLKMAKEGWAASSEGYAELSGPIMIGTNDEGVMDFSQVEFGEIKGLTGMGLGVDLGASYDFLDYFTASLSLLDLGMISWNQTTKAVAGGADWTFNGFGTIDETSELGEQLETLGSELSSMAQLKKTGEGLKSSKWLAATMNAGIEARMPFYEKLSFGLLGTHRFNGKYSWTEGRLSANLTPARCVGLAASYAFSNFGSSLGGVFNLSCPGFNFFIGVDSFIPLFSMTPQYIPINRINTNVSFGLNITFGAKKYDK